MASSTVPSWKRNYASGKQVTAADISYSAIPYWSSYYVPLSVVMGCLYGGLWTQLTALVALIIAPTLDWLLPLDEENPTKEEEKVMETMWRFSLVTWVWPLAETAALICVLYSLVHYSQTYTTSELIGIITSCGFMAGVGVNNAHELLHKRNSIEKALGQYLLLLASYQHYYIEHAIGHHINVATLEDPSTARLNESIFAFWKRAVPAAYSKAWSLEAERLKKSALPFWSIHNQMIIFTFNTVLIYTVVFVFFGLKGVFLFGAQGALGFLLVEATNYVEHYGLLRRETSPGVFELVNPTHSWNAPQRLSNYLLLKLQRHSDHHAWPNRRFQVLRSFPESPQLPASYGAMLLLTMVPPLFFKVMNPLVEKTRSEAAKFTLE